MNTTTGDSSNLRLHPLHAYFLAGMAPFFLAATIADWYFSKSSEVQWINFAAWLLVGGLLLTAVTGIWALVTAVTRRPHSTSFWIFFVLLLVTAIVGTVNSFIHARDGWGPMPTGLTLSAITFLLSAVAGWFGFRTGGAA